MFSGPYLPDGTVHAGKNKVTCTGWLCVIMQTEGVATGRDIWPIDGEPNNTGVGM